MALPPSRTAYLLVTFWESTAFLAPPRGAPAVCVSSIMFDVNGNRGRVERIPVFEERERDATKKESLDAEVARRVRRSQD